MNDLIFDPQRNTIYQWAPVCLSQPEIAAFEHLVDRTCNYLKAITNQKVKYLPLASKLSYRFQPPSEAPPPKFKYRKLRSMMPVSEEKRIEKVIEEVRNLKQKFETQYQNVHRGLQHRNQGSLAAIDDTLIVYNESQNEAQMWKNKMKVCETHLKQLKMKAVYFYAEFMQKQNKMLQSFVRLKIEQLHQKIANTSEYLFFQSSLDSTTVQGIAFQTNVRILFNNVYIETQYLRLLIKANLRIYEEHSYYEHSGDEPEVMAVRQREFKKLKKVAKQIQILKKQIRELYFHNYGRKRSRMIVNNPRKLQWVIKNEIGIYKNQYTNVRPWITWANGFICAVLIFALTAIIIFRQVNIQQLEKQPDYRRDFQVWRGASYLIWFNWVLAVVFFMLVRFKINYKLVLLQANTFVGKYQSFFWSASLLSTVYMILFLVYLLYRLDYLVGYDKIQYMGYFMWLINIAFMLNPFKILNYHSRYYFLNLFFKFVTFQFEPTNMRVAFLSQMIGSCAQPFSDLAFTVCSITFSEQETDLCAPRARIATYVFMMIYLLMRMALVTRVICAAEEGTDLTKTKMRLVSILCSINTVTSGFLYRTYTHQVLFIYWICSAVISTIAVTNVELRADWNILNFQTKDRDIKYLRAFPAPVYYVCGLLNLVLNIAWTLTISNNTQAFNIDSLYFFMLLAFVELWRRGMWMFFRIQEAHSKYVADLNAMADDQCIVEQVESVIQKIKSQNSVSEEMAPAYDPNVYAVVNYIATNFMKKKSSLKQSKKERKKVDENNLIKIQNKAQQAKQYPQMSFEYIKGMIIQKQRYIQQVNQFHVEIQAYLQLVYQNYEELTWEDDY